MGTAPNEIRSEIDQTRAELSRDVDRLVGRTDPRRVARRQGAQMRSMARRLRARMTDDRTAQAPPPISEGEQGFGENVSGQRGRSSWGPTLAVGAVAFGAGLMAAVVWQRSRRSTADSRGMRGRSMGHSRWTDIRARRPDLAGLGRWQGDPGWRARGAPAWRTVSRAREGVRTAARGPAPRRASDMCGVENDGTPR